MTWTLDLMLLRHSVFIQYCRSRNVFTTGESVETQRSSTPPQSPHNTVLPRGPWSNNGLLAKLSVSLRNLRTKAAKKIKKMKKKRSIPSGALLFVCSVVLRFYKSLFTFKMTETEILPKTLSPWRQCFIKI